MLLCASLHIFQSTLPRGSDQSTLNQASSHLYFNPRSLAGATAADLFQLGLVNISIHAPSRERPRMDLRRIPWVYFNPRSLAGATFVDDFILLGTNISIHAPSRERRHNLYYDNLYTHFNPRSLAGATYKEQEQYKDHQFQSTLPRGSDYAPNFPIRDDMISIHAPSRERHSGW